MDVYSKTFLVGHKSAFAPGWPKPDQIVWLASGVVHEACHSHQYSEGRHYRGKFAEVQCMEEQLEALKVIDADSPFIDYIEHLIEGADDPENQYWNFPNRHW